MTGWRPSLALGGEQSPPIPEHVAILGLGPSLEGFVDLTKKLGGTSAFCDEVWGINAIGDIIKCDRIFHMDDIRVQEMRAEAMPESNIANMVKWIKKHPGPIYTSRTHPDYPGLIEYPLEEVLNNIGFTYFNSTAAYAVGFAIYLGVKELSLWGFDFTYPNAHKAERGRACVEFLLGVAHSRGIKLGFPNNTSLIDGCHPEREKTYGYDSYDLEIFEEEGRIKVVKHLRDLPTVEEIEERYDHGKHPNPLCAA